MMMMMMKKKAIKRGHAMKYLSEAMTKHARTAINVYYILIKQGSRLEYSNPLQ